jgi:nucleotide-binding universal stress UspA family protein
MFATIVWATDGSEQADRALALVMGLALVHHSKIVAIHANELVGEAPMLADEEAVLAKIEGQVAELAELGLPAKLEVIDGTLDVPDLIATAAHKVNADLIVLGTHGRSVRSAMLGSVARGLLDEATCPVLAVPPPSRVRTAGLVRS